MGNVLTMILTENVRTAASYKSGGLGDIVPNPTQPRPWERGLLGAVAVQLHQQFRGD